MNFERALQLRWSDMDPNMHIRHSVYYDFGAQIRTEYLYENGLTPQLMMKHHIGPVLFREEAMFRKELRFGDDLVMNLMVVRLKKDGSRFSIRHEIKKKERCVLLLILMEPGLTSWNESSPYHRKLFSELLIACPRLKTLNG